MHTKDLVLLIQPVNATHDHTALLARAGFDVQTSPDDRISEPDVLAIAPDLIAVELEAARSADTLDLAQFKASSALLSTVLHHEPNPVDLLDALASAGIPRWLVVENCITPEFSPQFHQFTDRFFNSCLNEFEVDCVEQHRTLEEWVGLLTSYGSVTVIDEAFTVPGIPFPYSFLLVNRSA